MESSQISWKTNVLMMALLVVLVTVNLPHVDADAVTWNYGGEPEGGPEDWHEYYPDCGGKMQSPINIDTKHVIYDPDLALFDLKDYSMTTNVTITLVNKGGHTAEVIYAGKELYLRGGNLPADYKLEQYHFHWGQIDQRGSEHAVNGVHAPMEMHLVHSQVGLDSTVAPAHPFGLAVLGFFFKVGQHNDKYDKLLKYFDNITSADQSVAIPTFPVSDLLPSGRLDYFRYDGSLTTPPCYETVLWSLAKTYIEISEDQLNKFRALHDSFNKSLVDDFRPLQSRSGRTVTTTFNPEAQGGGDSGNFLTASTIVVLFSAIMCFFLRLF